VRELFSFGINFVPGAEAVARRIGIRVTVRERKSTLPTVPPVSASDPEAGADAGW
jgi:hypothetical protein